MLSKKKLIILYIYMLISLSSYHKKEKKNKYVDLEYI